MVDVITKKIFYLPRVSISMIMSSVWIISPPASDPDSSVLDVLGNLCRAEMIIHNVEISFVVTQLIEIYIQQCVTCAYM